MDFQSTIGGVTKIWCPRGKVLWQLDIHGRQLIFSTSELLNQWAFRRRCLSMLGIDFGKVSTLEWNRIVNEIVKQCKERDGTASECLSWKFTVKP